MLSRTTKVGLAAAAAGAAMLVMTAAPASAFTLSSPSLAPPVAASNIDRVCWQQGHPGPCWWHHGWGWHGGWGWHHRHHCWMSPWGWRCHWW